MDNPEGSPRGSPPPCLWPVHPLPKPSPITHICHVDATRKAVPPAGRQQSGAAPAGGSSWPRGSTGGPLREEEEEGRLLQPPIWASLLGLLAKPPPPPNSRALRGQVDSWVSMHTCTHPPTFPFLEWPLVLRPSLTTNDVRCPCAVCLLNLPLLAPAKTERPEKAWPANGTLPPPHGPQRKAAAAGGESQASPRASSQAVHRETPGRRAAEHNCTLCQVRGRGGGSLMQTPPPGHPTQQHILQEPQALTRWQRANCALWCELHPFLPAPHACR